MLATVVHLDIQQSKRALDALASRTNSEWIADEGAIGHQRVVLAVLTARVNIRALGQVSRAGLVQRTAYPGRR